jgi:hypothetical protein
VLTFLPTTRSSSYINFGCVNLHRICEQQ